MCCSLLQCVAVLQHTASALSRKVQLVKQYMCCSVLQRVAACCRVLLRVIVLQHTESLLFRTAQLLSIYIYIHINMHIHIFSKKIWPIELTIFGDFSTGLKSEKFKKAVLGSIPAFLGECETNSRLWSTQKRCVFAAKKDLYLPWLILDE